MTATSMPMKCEATMNWWWAIAGRSRLRSATAYRPRAPCQRAAGVIRQNRSRRLSCR
jgi:hypothetical protein